MQGLVEQWYSSPSRSFISMVPQWALVVRLAVAIQRQWTLPMHDGRHWSVLFSPSETIETFCTIATGEVLLPYRYVGDTYIWHFSLPINGDC